MSGRGIRPLAAKSVLLLFTPRQFHTPPKKYREIFNVICYLPFMWISPRFNALFVHCPKTAGTALRELFHQLDPGMVRFINHLTASQGRASIHHETWDRLFKFSVCRHPCEQLVSHYCNVVRMPEHTYHERAIRDGFSAWLRWKEETPDHRGVCSHFIDLPVDFVMKFEDMHREFEILKGRLNMDPAIQLPRVNVGEGKPHHWQEWFGPADLAYVRERFSADFLRFGYELPESVDIVRV